MGGARATDPEAEAAEKSLERIVGLRISAPSLHQAARWQS
jgi:hypothetical protein